MTLAPRALARYLLFAACLAAAGASAQTPRAIRVDPAAPVQIQLAHPLSAEAAERLHAQGVELLHHYGNGVYLASATVSGGPLPAATSPPTIPAAAFDDFGLPPGATDRTRVSIDLTLAYAEAADRLQGVLAQADFTPAAEQMMGGVMLRGTVALGRVDALLAHPLVVGANVSPGADEPYNLEGRILEGASVLNRAGPSAPDLNGAGITIGIGDGGKLAGHPDIGDRVVQSTEYYNAGWGNHPDFVAGIIGGAGILDPTRRGVACEAELVVESSSSIVYHAPKYLRELGMTLTNNSYGPSFRCGVAGRYFSSSASVDAQLASEPYLMHVYAAGNSGTNDCADVPAGYATIPAGAQNAKNSITVGNLRFDRTLRESSSAGPTADGRVKPELVAVGSDVISNDRAAGYTRGTGTSFASPGVTALLGLFSQRFQQLHPGQLPPGALLKAVACNTAEDLGNPGPDYRFGFGLISGTHGVAALERGDYLLDTLGVGQTKRHTLRVPDGLELGKALLYWTDAKGSTRGDATLVSDLDLRLITPSGKTIRPWILDPLRPELPAVRGVDTLNNIEQLTWTSPEAGSYTLEISGGKLPLGATGYVLTWELLAPEIQLTAPLAAQAVVPNEPLIVAWEASPGQTGDWTIDYALGDAAWRPLATVPNAERSYRWAGTADQTGELRIRVTNNATQLATGLSAPARLLGTPTAIESEQLCGGDVYFDWAPVPGAAGYRIFHFDGNAMRPLHDVVDPAYAAPAPAGPTRQYFSVAAIDANGRAGQRAAAVDFQTTDVIACRDLPAVEFRSLGATGLHAVEIDWTTSSEHGRGTFAVQRAAAELRGPDWTELALLEHEGGSARGASYSFQDANPPNVERLAYRIEHTAEDGTVTHSEVTQHFRPVEQAPPDSTVFATVSGTSSPARGGPARGARAASPEVVLSQNPTRAAIYLTSRARSAHGAELYDLRGRRIAEFTVVPGRNELTWPTDTVNAVYLLQVRGPGQAHTLRLLRP